MTIEIAQMPPRTKTNRKVHVSAKKGAMPRSLEPMLPSLVGKPFSSSGWLFEPKWDGWRTLCFLRDGKAHLVSRRKNSLTERFPELKDIGKLIRAKSAILDGEIVALDH